MFSLAAIGAALRRIPIWVYIALFILSGLFFFGRYMKEQGRKEVHDEWSASIERGKQEIERIKQQSERITVKVETKYVDRIKEIRVKGDTIVKQVPVYISRDLPELPGAFRVLLDSASQGTVPDPASFAHGAPIAPQDVATSVTDNYATCLANAEQLTGLQEWANEQKRLNP